MTNFGWILLILLAVQQLGAAETSPAADPSKLADSQASSNVETSLNLSKTTKTIQENQSELLDMDDSALLQNERSNTTKDSLPKKVTAGILIGLVMLLLVAIALDIFTEEDEEKAECFSDKTDSRESLHFRGSGHTEDSDWKPRSLWGRLKKSLAEKYERRRNTPGSFLYFVMGPNYDPLFNRYDDRYEESTGRKKEDQPNAEEKEFYYDEVDKKKLT